MKFRQTRRQFVATLGATTMALAAPYVARADNVVLRFLHDESDPPQVAFFNAAIRDFQQQNPGITVEMEVVASTGRLQKVAASINAGTMPDIFKILPEERFNFGRKGFLTSLDDLIAQVGADEYGSNVLVPVDGTVYDIPYTMGKSSTMWCRSDLLEAKGLGLPTTWDEYMAASQALTEGAQYGTVMPAAKNRAATLFLAPLLWSAGGNFFDKDLNVAFDSPQAVQALTYMKELARYAPPGIAGYVHSEMVSSYLTRQVGMDIWFGRVISNAIASAPDLVKVTKATNFPIGPVGIGVGFANANSFAVPSEAVGGKNAEAAKKFLHYILTSDRAVDFALTAWPHLVPPLKSTRLDPRLEAGSIERPDIGKVAFDLDNTLDLESEAGARVVDGKVVRAGNPNPYIGPIVARDIISQAVQRVLLTDEAPASAVSWAAEQMNKVVAELK